MSQTAHRLPDETRERRDMRAVPGLEPARFGFTRWLGWLLVLILVVGGTALIWYGIASDDSASLPAPAIENIDPHLNPEVFNASGAGQLVAPALETIDPHENPEILRNSP